MRGRVVLALLAMIGTGPAMSNPANPAPDVLRARLPVGTLVKPLTFANLDGWAADDHPAALAAFIETCKPILDGTAALRDALPPPEALKSACAAGRIAAGQVGSARRFFETHFQPYEILPESGAGFLTAYFEPELRASPVRTAEFPVPVLARPADLVTIKAGETLPGIEPPLQAARKTAAGYEPFPERAAIWAGALDGQGLEIAWLRDHAELFITQVQGSARLAMTDGTRSRLVYAGRNGHPYTSIGRRLVATGAMALEGMTLAKLMAWLRDHPAEGRALMEENRSYVFFARDDAAPEDRGPIGGAGVPLTAGRSLAIDRTIWPYGLPVFVDVSPLSPEGGRSRIARLMTAQDTGSAIVGPARGDFFTGSGDEAGVRAGLFRDPMRFVVLWPREKPIGDAP
jgi:membrane-bound lytic murein transglycosylase A